MSDFETHSITVNGFPTRVWRKGKGPKLGFLAGLGGLPKWIPFLDHLAEKHTIIVPSLPGFPGGDRGHSVLDSHLDWLLALRDILDKAGLSSAHLIGSSIGASLAAEVAAVWPGSVQNLVLIAPFGLFEPNDPTQNPWAQRAQDVPALMCADGDIWRALKAPPESDVDLVEWRIEQTRADEAAARLLWPLGDTRLGRRLERIKAPTLILWGDKDQLIPQSYANRFAAGIKAKTKIRVIEGAGHLVELDRPAEVARKILDWTAG